MAKSIMELHEGVVRRSHYKLNYWCVSLSAVSDVVFVAWVVTGLADAGWNIRTRTHVSFPLFLCQVTSPALLFVSGLC